MNTFKLKCDEFSILYLDVNEVIMRIDLIRSGPKVISIFDFPEGIEPALHLSTLRDAARRVGADLNAVTIEVANIFPTSVMKLDDVEVEQAHKRILAQFFSILSLDSSLSVAKTNLVSGRWPGRFNSRIEIK